MEAASTCDVRQCMCTGLQTLAYCCVRLALEQTMNNVFQWETFALGPHGSIPPTGASVQVLLASVRA